MTTSSFTPATAAGSSHKLWGGRFKGVMTAPEFDALNNSIGVDFRLWPYDVELSKAWAMAGQTFSLSIKLACTEKFFPTMWPAA